ncbi:hypothetical protein AAFF_G00430520, partial [Aldrovandia affinis]
RGQTGSAARLTHRLFLEQRVSGRRTQWEGRKLYHLLRGAAADGPLRRRGGSSLSPRSARANAATESEVSSLARECQQGCEELTVEPGASREETQRCAGSPAGCGHRPDRTGDLDFPSALGAIKLRCISAYGGQDRGRLLALLC